MSDAAKALDLRALVTNGLIDVFSTMLSLEAVASQRESSPHFEDRVTGCIGLAGESVVGAVYLHFPSELAGQAAAAMMGMNAEECGEPEVNDVVGELCNMVAGNLKSTLCDLGAPCAVSPPSVIRGRSFVIDTSNEFRKETICFDCQNHTLVVEVHLKFG